jgi:hypothetical protein
MTMTTLLILTVGTGTAGKYSDVAAGLARTIDLTAPRRFWLVPSRSEKSLPVADLIRESVRNPDAFCPWSDVQAYRAIEDPDDIHQCRCVLREVIQKANGELRADERLVVNPTSGTKQMSAGATLAALDEEIGEIMFTVGERADGVVKTGTERMATLSTRQFLLERDLGLAGELFVAGAFYAAAKILKRYSEPEALAARETALRKRHESVYGHGCSPVNSEVTEKVRARLHNLLVSELPELRRWWSADWGPPRSLPASV